MTVKLAKFDAADYLTDDETRAHFLSEALATDDPAFIARAIGVIAKSRGMTDVAKETGLSRQSLYRALGENGNPELVTVVKVLQACGVRLNAEPTKRAPIKSRRVKVA